jgi:hypothetical protein
MVNSFCLETGNLSSNRNVLSGSAKLRLAYIDSSLLSLCQTANKLDDKFPSYRLDAEGLIRAKTAVDCHSQPPLLGKLEAIVKHYLRSTGLQEVISATWSHNLSFMKVIAIAVTQNM